MNTPTPTPTPRTDAATYPADCLGTTLVTNRDCSRALERELTALTTERDQLRGALALGQQNCDDAYDELRGDRDELRADVVRLTIERDQLRAENTNFKATDTRPLLTGTLTHAGFCRIGEEQLDGVFISIDREQIKGLRHLPMYPQIELRVAAITEGAK